MKVQVQSPLLLVGDMAVDDRGEVCFVNDFDFSQVKRFYTVSNHRRGFVRAWHAHRHEGKYVMVVAGTALVGAVAIDDWDHPSKTAHVWRYTLSVHRPAVLYIPPGYANGFMSLTQDAKVIFFSTGTLEQSQKDDIRFPARYWDIWTIEPR
jgi:dTDP-4-dehydrorhamnose 3,5-epimerase-like enzyme